MDCQKALDKMSEYIDYQLSDEESIIFENHMKDCENCQKEFATLENIVLKLKNIEDIEPPSYLKENIMKAIIEDSKPKKFLDFKVNSNIINFGKKYSLVASILLFFVVYNTFIKTTPQEQIQPNMENARAMQMSFDDNSGIVENRGISLPTAPYNYEKTILEEDEMNLFSHYISLEKGMFCEFSFENTSNHNVRIHLENSQGQSVYESSIIPKNSIEIVTYSMNDVEDDAKEVFGIIISGDYPLKGIFNVDISEI